MRIALLFPGQGSQLPGMADPWLAHPAGREAIDRVSDALREDVAAAARDEERLKDTAFVQPALLACDVAAGRTLEAEGLSFDVVAGHSLGEYPALVAAGTLSLDDAIDIVIERGRAMAAAAGATPGTMSAIVGPSAAEVEELCTIAGRGDVVAIANLNAPAQTVVSGSVSAVERVEELATSRGAKVMRLRVSGAFHSPLMRPAVPSLRTAIAAARFAPPRVPVIPNAAGKLESHPHALRDLLSRQLVSPVRWEGSMRSMADLGVDLYVEAGPGEVLTRLAKRCVRGARGASVGSPEQAQALVSSLEASVR